ncbi:hypothetical protein FHU31_004258 [Mycolicibacterium fluoranthenivorans]|uniref:Uncharacterized protein n=1 Tax=Mycolicibacterium fluoranthenivorans TaxID=258505 RepID=A0A7X5U2P9_9MYCO|nr:hypothetical protein [Mycolicibacterium fluoranthenivorans]NIH97268.1 hypothetical protein [Mycolicibacterium fluoranthenivorans]
MSDHHDIGVDGAHSGVDRVDDPLRPFVRPGRVVLDGQVRRYGGMAAPV